VLSPAEGESKMSAIAREISEACKGNLHTLADLTICSRVFEQVVQDADLVISPISRQTLSLIVVSEFMQTEKRTETNVLILVRARRAEFDRSYTCPAFAVQTLPTAFKKKTAGSNQKIMEQVPGRPSRKRILKAYRLTGVGVGDAADRS
jgi:hypothetical protein